MYRNGRMEPLPDLPHPVEEASLTFNKGKARLCGGQTNNISYSKQCYELSIFATSPKWEKFADLPVAMTGHSSIQVRDDMWVFYRTKTYVVSQTGNTMQFKWPHGAIPPYSCAETNGVSTILIPGQSRDVYINSDVTSPETWQKFATLPTGPRGRSCLLLGLVMYVTGGGDPAVQESYMINIETGSVKKVSDLLAGRRYHGMCVIDGAPAVFGGYNGTFIDSTEIFDVATETWRASNIKMVEQSYDVASVSFAIN